MSIFTSKLKKFGSKFRTKRGLIGSILNLIILIKARPWKIVEWGGDVDFIAQVVSWFWGALDYGLVQLVVVLIGLWLIWSSSGKEQGEALDRLNRDTVKGKAERLTRELQASQGNRKGLIAELGDCNQRLEELRGLAREHWLLRSEHRLRGLNVKAIDFHDCKATIWCVRPGDWKWCQERLTQHFLESTWKAQCTMGGSYPGLMPPPLHDVWVESRNGDLAEEVLLALREGHFLLNLNFSGNVNEGLGENEISIVVYNSPDSAVSL